MTIWGMGEEGGNIHSTGGPLHFLDEVEAAMDDELVHMSCFLAEVREAIAALLGRAELMLEERVVLCADYGEVIGHCMAFASFAAPVP